MKGKNNHISQKENAAAFCFFEEMTNENTGKQKNISTSGFLRNMESIFI